MEHLGQFLALWGAGRGCLSVKSASLGATPHCKGEEAASEVTVRSLGPVCHGPPSPGTNSPAKKAIAQPAAGLLRPPSFSEARTRFICVYCNQQTREVSGPLWGEQPSYPGSGRASAAPSPLPSPQEEPSRPVPAGRSVRGDLCGRRAGRRRCRREFSRLPGAGRPALESQRGPHSLRVLHPPPRRVSSPSLGFPTGKMGTILLLPRSECAASLPEALPGALRRAQQVRGGAGARGREGGGALRAHPRGRREGRPPQPSSQPPASAPEGGARAGDAAGAAPAARPPRRLTRALALRFPPRRVPARRWPRTGCTRTRRWRR